MMQLINDLWLKRRDIVSDGFDESLSYINALIPLKIHAYPTGEKCWTWKIPEKWTVTKAFIEELDGRRILDLKDNPLHIVSYSLPINKIISREELLKHIFTNPKRPNSIPFEFKYYERDWGFCLEHNKLIRMKKMKYRVVIDSHFSKGKLKVGELELKGKKPQTIVIIAHLCHPGMANDDLTGVSVLVDIAKKMLRVKHNYTYKFLLLPETIGSVAYLSHNENIIPNLISGIFLEMLGTQKELALQHSFQGNTKIDRIAKFVMSKRLKKFREGDFHNVVVNDEMVFNGPGVNIPTISLSRFPYSQYHSSDDNPKIIREDKLIEARDTILEILNILDKDYYPKRKFSGPVFLSGYNLWVDWRVDPQLNEALDQIMLRLEGDKSIFDIADETNLSFNQVYDFLEKFADQKLISKQKDPDIFSPRF